MNFEVEDKEGMMKDLSKLYKDAQVDNLDGVTIMYKDWWFNCRPSNTEPLLRLNVEAETQEVLEEKLSDLKKHLGKPVDH